MKKSGKRIFCPFCHANLPEKFYEKIVKTIRSRPDLSYQRIADENGLSKTTVIRHAREAGIRRPQKNGLIYGNGK